VKGLVRRLRGVLGLGAFGGLAGALAGSLFWVGVFLLGETNGVVFGSLGWTAALWGTFGAFGAAGAGALLTLSSSRRTFDQVSPWRLAAFGAAMGFLAPPAYMFVMTGAYWGPVLSILAAASGVLGGSIGYGLVAVAKRAPTELVSGNEPALLEATENRMGESTAAV
jgi:hypothetical protein